MSTSTISKTKFAKQLGVSDAYIYKIQDQLSFVKIKGKKKKQIDLLGSNTLDFLRRREANNISIPGEEQETELQTPHRSSGNNPSGKTTTPAEARNLKDRNTELKNEELEIKISQTRGDLVRKELSTDIFSKIYSIHENQFKALAVKTNPKTEATYTSEYQIKAAEILEALGVKITNDTRNTIMKILNTGEADRFRRLNEIMEDETMGILKKYPIRNQQVPSYRGGGFKVSIIPKLKSITNTETNVQLAEKISEHGKRIDSSRIAKWNTTGQHQSTRQLIMLLISEIEFRDETIKLLNFYKDA